MTKVVPYQGGLETRRSTGGASPALLVLRISDNLLTDFRLIQKRLESYRSNGYDIGSARPKPHEVGQNGNCGNITVDFMEDCDFMK